MNYFDVEKETIKISRIFVNESEISPHLKCFICKTVFNNPVVVDCGHSFCYECIKPFFQGTTNKNKKNKKNPKCPKCNEIITSSINETSRDLLAYNLVMDLEVKCNNHNICPWQGKLSELIAHKTNCDKTLKIIEENQKKEEKDKRNSQLSTSHGSENKYLDTKNNSNNNEKITINMDEETKAMMDNINENRRNKDFVMNKDNSICKITTTTKDMEINERITSEKISQLKELFG